MCLTKAEKLILQEFYEYNRIPLWILDSNSEIQNFFFYNHSSDLEKLSSNCVNKLIANLSISDFDIFCYENELYFMFSFIRRSETFYLLAGPMLLSGVYHITEMKTLSFAPGMNSTELKSLVENLPVISFRSFSSYLRITMLLLKKDALRLEEISNYKFSNLHGSLNQTLIHELFENIEDYQIHTPYSHELAILNCVKDGNVTKLEATYKALPQTKYGHMSNNPLRQLFYGCIANTTLVTRYAIEGGLEEETAFTLSDVYIKQMEKCRTLYELNILNEKMAVDFTSRVAKIKNAKHPAYTKPVSKCIEYIIKNIHSKITLNKLAKEVDLAPKYLSSLFRKETGQTISSYIEEKKIDEAKNLLTYSEYTYSHISQYLSFNSQSYFICIFKKHVGITPKEYRKRYSK